MSSNPSGGVPILLVVDRTAVDSTLAELRRGISVPISFTAGSAASSPTQKATTVDPVAQAQNSFTSSAVTPPTAGTQPGTFAVTSPTSGVGSSVQTSAAAITPSLIAALQNAANAMQSAAQQMQRAAEASTRIANKAAGTSAVAGDPTARLVNAEYRRLYNNTVDGLQEQDDSEGPRGAGGGGGRAFGSSALPRNLRSLISRGGLAIGGPVGAAVALGVEGAREFAVQQVQNQNQVRFAGEAGAGPEEIARIKLGQLQGIRSGGFLGIPSLLLPLIDSGKIQDIGDLGKNLGAAEEGQSRVVRAFRDRDFERGASRLKAETIARGLSAFNSNTPVQRQISSIQAASRQRTLDIEYTFNDEIARQQQIPDDGSLTAANLKRVFDRNSTIARLENDRQEAVSLEGRARDIESLAVVRDESRREGAARFRNTSTARQILIGAGLTRESRGESISTRGALSSIEQIVSETEQQRQGAAISGQTALIPSISQLGRARLAAFRQSLTESTVGVEVNPFAKSLNGAGTLNFGAVQARINSAFHQASNVSTTDVPGGDIATSIKNQVGLGGGVAQAGDGPAKDIAVSTDKMATEIGAMAQNVQLITNFVQNVKVA